MFGHSLRDRTYLDDAIVQEKYGSADVLEACGVYRPTYVRGDSHETAQPLASPRPGRLSKFS